MKKMIEFWDKNFERFLVAALVIALAFVTFHCTVKSAQVDLLKEEIHTLDVKSTAKQELMKRRINKLVLDSAVLADKNQHFRDLVCNGMGISEEQLGF